MITTDEAQMDWEQVLEKAEIIRWAAALHHALEICQRCFDTPLPDGFMDRLAATCTPAEIKLVARLANPARTSLMIFGDIFATLNWQGKLRLLLAFLFPAPSYMRRRYQPKPNYLWPFWYLVRWSEIVTISIRTLFLSLTTHRR
jgi:hypothetical protein